MAKYLITNFEGNKAEIATYENVDILIVHNEVFDQEIAKSFKNIEILKSNNDTIVLANKQSLLAIASYINNEHNTLWEALFELNEEFYSRKFNYKKFRGDLGELIFIYNIGGEKIYDNMTCDVVYKNDMYEIKTFSKQTLDITINHQQLCENTKKIAISIEMDDYGLSMNEMISKLNNNTPFKKYLKDSYSDLNIFNLKFKMNGIFDITKYLEPPQLPNFFKNAKYKISIESLIKNNIGFNN